MKSWDNSSDISPLKQNLKSEKKKKKKRHSAVLSLHQDGDGGKNVA